MKNLLIFLSITTFSLLSAQDYIPFATDSATWKVQFSYSEDSQGSNYYYSYHLAGDTTIEGVDYSLLYARPSGYGGFGGGMSSFNPDTITPYVLEGAIREDSTKKVWYRDFPGGDLYGYLDLGENYITDTLLFDFGLQVGDSMLFHEYEGGYLELLDIYFDPIYERNVYSFEDDFQWMEGFGGLRAGPFSVFVDFWNVSGNSFSLSCFKEYGEYMYGNSNGTYTCDGFISSLDEIKIGTLNVYPNPTVGELRVSIPGTSALLRVLRWQLFDVLGRQIPNSEFEIQNGTGDNLESLILDLESLNQGMYLVQLLTDEGVYSAQVLKE